ncbi:hypothetical protein OS175_05595 [Marinicella sp. S1101]|uniref:hypothetical protein n=1 Tax=Marinicella marina TaxID=2996016 RepID=UPI002260A26E|nr:hypothetical protein [Marinicella marina]MCX7553344.1 hypothetical protein [Marinicella marina]MDJ1139076.1 hypothetical protein [Marinicella marina]
MTQQNYSKDGLLNFLKESAVSGIMNPGVARSRKTAAEKLLDHVTAEERINLRVLDVDELCSRIHKIEDSSIREEAMNLYNARLKSALDDYFNYLQCPESFTSTGSNLAPVKQVQKRDSEEQKALESIALHHAGTQDDIIPIPLREGLIVYLQGLPLNLTQTEANKIVNVVKAYVQSDDGAADE